jgi:hypothetical protein
MAYLLCKLERDLPIHAVPALGLGFSLSGATIPFAKIKSLINALGFC